MPDVITLLSIYYICAAEAALGNLTQDERFACNATYQAAKRTFLSAEERNVVSSRLTPSENVLAYQRFKAWEQENAELVARLKSK